MRKEVLLVCPAPESCRVEPGSKPVVSRFFRHTRLSLLSVAAARPSCSRRIFPRNSVQASRGCPERCTFCSITSFYKAHYRHRPVDEIIKEIEGLCGI
jgi:radical SAM superfamily enzyme YgiQ (UPF0313 family)